MVLLHRIKTSGLIWLAVITAAMLGSASVALAGDVVTAPIPAAKAKALGRTKVKTKIARVKVRPVTATRGTVKAVVPMGMRAGSTVQGARSFYRTVLKENSLAYIRLGRKYTDVLKMWGNPTRITVGGQTAKSGGGMTSSDAGGAMPGGGGMMPGGGGIRPGGGMMPGAGGMMPGGGGIRPGGGGMMPGGGGIRPGGGGMMPGAGGMMPGGGGIRPGGGMMPGGGGMMPGGGGMMPGAGGMMPGGGGMRANVATAASSTALGPDEVLWTYDLRNGVTIEFILTNGNVTRITAGGTGPWGGSKTRMGLQFGDTYKLLLSVAGYPVEEQVYVGRFLKVSYATSNGVVFLLENNKLVGNNKIVGIIISSDVEQMDNP